MLHKVTFPFKGVFYGLANLSTICSVEYEAGFLPVRNRKVACFSHISILWCQKWSSCQTHPVFAACLSAGLTDWDQKACVGVRRRSRHSLYAENKQDQVHWGDCGRGRVDISWRWKLCRLYKTQRPSPHTQTHVHTHAHKRFTQCESKQIKTDWYLLL